MSTSTLFRVDQQRRSIGLAAKLTDYVELTKPRILTLVLITVALTSVIATGGQPVLVRLFHTLLGTTLVAGSASIFNQWMERTTDRRMTRTQDRPIPAGRLGSIEALILGGASVLIGLSYLSTTTTLSATMWAAATWFIYVAIYTPLKTKTWLNTAVGAVPGAMPVLIGWTATGTALDTRAWCLFLLVYFWQFPHFMAIAWLYRQQYADAGMKMLTVVDPTGRRAGMHSITSAIAVLMVSIVPAFLGFQISALYLVGSMLLGVIQIIRANQFMQSRNEHSARKLLRATLVYLPLQLLLVTLLSISII